MQVEKCMLITWCGTAAQDPKNIVPTKKNSVEKFARKISIVKSSSKDEAKNPDKKSEESKFGSSNSVFRASKRGINNFINSINSKSTNSLNSLATQKSTSSEKKNSGENAANKVKNSFASRVSYINRSINENISSSMGRLSGFNHSKKSLTQRNKRKSFSDLNTVSYAFNDEDDKRSSSCQNTLKRKSKKNIHVSQIKDIHHSVVSLHSYEPDIDSNDLEIDDDNDFKIRKDGFLPIQYRSSRCISPVIRARTKYLRSLRKVSHVRVNSADRHIHHHHLRNFQYDNFNDEYECLNDFNNPEEMKPIQHKTSLAKIRVIPR